MTSCLLWKQNVMVATDQPVCDFVHAHTSPVGDKRFTIVTIVHA